MEEYKKKIFFDEFMYNFDKWIFDNKLWHIEFELKELRTVIKNSRYKSTTYKKKILASNDENINLKIYESFAGGKLYYQYDNNFIFKNNMKKYSDIYESAKYELELENIYIITDKSLILCYNNTFELTNMLSMRYLEHLSIIIDNDIEMSNILINYIKYLEEEDSP